MAVSREDVLRVAALARLRLEPGEVERFTAQLNSILDHIGALSRVTGASSQAGGELVDWASPQRSDAGQPDELAFPPSELAPAWADGFFAVPRLPALDVAALEDAFEDKARVEGAGGSESRREAGAGEP